MPKATLSQTQDRAGGGRSRNAGFTLTELMITVTIAAILLGIGVPSFSGFILGQRVKTATFDIGYAVTYARSEAIKRNSNVSIVAAATGWKDGWNVTTVTTSGTVTLSRQSAYAGVTISGPGTDLVFTNSGRPQTTPVTPFQISGGTTMNCVAIGLSGLPNRKKGIC